jgi:hypothetical protein
VRLQQGRSRMCEQRAIAVVAAALMGLIGVLAGG